MTSGAQESFSLPWLVLVTCGYSPQLHLNPDPSLVLTLTIKLTLTSACSSHIQVSGYMPFDDSNIRKMVRKQYGKQMDFPRKKPIRAECQDLILSILEADVNRRATIKEILAHPWFQGVSTSPPPPPARHTEQGHSDVSHKELHPADGYMTIRRQDALVPIATGSSLLHMPDNSVHKVKDKDMYESLTVYSAYHDKAPYGEHQCCPHHAKVKDSGRKTALGHVTEGGEATDVKKKTFRHFFSRGQ